jgi:hypothetical protein
MTVNAHTLIILTSYHYAHTDEAEWGSWRHDSTGAGSPCYDLVRESDEEKKVEARERSIGGGSGKIERQWRACRSRVRQAHMSFSRHEASWNDVRRSRVQWGARPTCRHLLFPPKSNGSQGGHAGDPTVRKKGRRGANFSEEVALL